MVTNSPLLPALGNRPVVLIRAALKREGKVGAILLTDLEIVIPCCIFLVYIVIDKSSSVFYGVS